MGQYGLKVFVELVLKNVKEIQKKAQSALSSIGISTSSGGGSKKSTESSEGKEQGKKTTGLLGGILKALGPLAILLKLKPLTDLIEILLGFVVLAFMKYLKLWEIVINTAQKIWDYLVELVGNINWEGLMDKLKEGWEFLKNLPGKIWEFISNLPSQIWEFVKNLAVNLWEFIKQLPQMIWDLMKVIWEFLVELPGKIWEFLVQGFEFIREVITSVWDFLKEKFLFLEKIESWTKSAWDTLKKLPSAIWEFMKALPENIWQFLKDLPSQIWEFMKQLPQLIWDKLQGLAKMIGQVIKEAIGNLNPFGGGGLGKKGKTAVDDALITKNGDIVKFNPDDNIFATKGNGMGGQTVINNFYGVTPQEMIDVIRRQLAEDELTATRF